MRRNCFNCAYFIGNISACFGNGSPVVENPAEEKACDKWKEWNGNLDEDLSLLVGINDALAWENCGSIHYYDEAEKLAPNLFLARRRWSNEDWAGITHDILKVNGAGGIEQVKTGIG